MASDDTRTKTRTRTIAKTLWSETQVDMLRIALRGNRPDAEVIEILRDLLGRGLPPDYLVDKAKAAGGVIAANRLRGLLKRHALS